VEFLCGVQEGRRISTTGDLPHVRQYSAIHESLEEDSCQNPLQPSWRISREAAEIGQPVSISLCQYFRKLSEYVSKKIEKQQVEEETELIVTPYEQLTEKKTTEMVSAFFLESP